MQHKTLLERIFWIKYILCSIMLYFFIIGGLWAYWNVFQPSYYSVRSACNMISDDELNDLGYITTGVFKANFKNESENGIKIYVPSKYDDSWIGRNEYKETSKYHRTVKHEKIHQWQFENVPLILNCNHKFLKYLSEVQANIGEYFYK